GRNRDPRCDVPHPGPLMIPRRHLSVWLALATLLAATGARAAVTFVTDEAGIYADGQIDWGVLGPGGGTVLGPGPLAVPGLPGVTAVVSDAPNGWQRYDAGVNICGNYPPGERLLWTPPHGGPTMIEFSSPVSAVGAHFGPAFFDSYAATIEAFDASG